MSKKMNTTNCPAMCWQISAAAGVLAFVLLWLLGGFSLLGALVLAAVLAVLLGVMLRWGLCRDADLQMGTQAGTDPAYTHTPAHTPVTPVSPADAGAGGAAVAQPTQPTEQTPEPTAEHTAEVADTAETETLIPSETEGFGADEGAAPVARPETTEMPTPAPTTAATPSAVQPAPAAQDAETGARVGYSPATETPVSDHQTQSVPAGTGLKPQGLSAPRDGSGDDLTRIRGVGPKLAATLNEMGYYHLDQIAAWTPDQVAWVDQNLTGFRGRATRDEWVAQARTLTSGNGQGA